MFQYDISDKLKKKLQRIGKKDNVLAINFKKKLMEVINHNYDTISTYKDLKAPKNEFKRIHLTSNFVLIFKVTLEKNHILFVDILHRDKAYK